MACRLLAPSHRLNQCWLIVNWIRLRNGGHCVWGGGGGGGGGGGQFLPQDVAFSIHRCCQAPPSGDELSPLPWILGFAGRRKCTKSFLWYSAFQDGQIMCKFSTTLHLPKWMQTKWVVSGHVYFLTVYRRLVCQYSRNLDTHTLLQRSCHNGSTHFSGHIANIRRKTVMFSRWWSTCVVTNIHDWFW